MCVCVFFPSSPLIQIGLYLDPCICLLWHILENFSKALLPKVWSMKILVSESPGSLLEMMNLEPHSTLTVSEFIFSSPRWLSYTLKFEKHYSKVVILTPSCTRGVIKIHKCPSCIYLPWSLYLLFSLDFPLPESISLLRFFFFIFNKIIWFSSW